MRATLALLVLIAAAALLALPAAAKEGVRAKLDRLFRFDPPLRRRC